MSGEKNSLEGFQQPWRKKMSGFSRRDLLHGSISVIAVLLTSDAAMAEDAYASRPIHLIVGFTPGSAADITARAFGNGAEDILGQKMIVEDKPGAGSKVAAEYVKHAAADGYTLFLATLSIVTDQAMKPDPAFNLLSDFAPITLLASGAVILVVSPQSNLHSVAELIALAKSKPAGRAEGGPPFFAPPPALALLLDGDARLLSRSCEFSK
jgi:tripartite-type tricarboxylate transporter receptor subunit TctC